MALAAESGYLMTLAGPGAAGPGDDEFVFDATVDVDLIGRETRNLEPRRDAGPAGPAVRFGPDHW